MPEFFLEGIVLKQYRRAWMVIVEASMECTIP
jgi:hypothetical protein